MQRESGTLSSPKFSLSLLKNPLTIWLKWYFDTLKLLNKNKGKYLKIGYQARINNTNFGMYNTIYDQVCVSTSLFGDFVYVGDRTSISNTSIGKFCSIGPDVRIGLGMHPTHFISTFPAFFSTKRQAQITFVEEDLTQEMGRVTIGNDVWIGANVIILYNVTIGDGAIIAAGSVVTKNVEPYSIVGGVPAHLIKKRFSEEEISQLLALKWWEKDLSWLIDNAKFFSNHQEFLKMFK